MTPARRILLIHSDPKERARLSAALSTTAGHVHCAGDAAQAVSRAQRHVYGVMLCELELPGSGGSALLRCLRFLQPHACSMLLAAKNTPSVSIAPDSNITRIIASPVDVEVLQQWVAEAFAQHEERDPLLYGRKGRPPVLVVGASTHEALLLRRVLARDRVRLTRVPDIEASLAALETQRFGLVLLCSHEEAAVSRLGRLLTGQPGTPVVVVLPAASAATAVELIRTGAEDCVTHEHLLDASLVHRLYFAMERHRTRESLVYWSQHDPLTGLANRHLFESRLAEALLRAERGGNPVSLLFLDLDGFKAVNDVHGHRFGDKVLAAVGRKLQEHSRRLELIARLGGDEFTVLLEGGPQEAQAAAERLLAAIASIREVDGQPVELRASVGTGSAPPALGAEALLRSADQAMYHAKRRNAQTHAGPPSH